MVNTRVCNLRILPLSDCDGHSGFGQIRLECLEMCLELLDTIFFASGGPPGGLLRACRPRGGLPLLSLFLVWKPGGQPLRFAPLPPCGPPLAPLARDALRAPPIHLAYASLRSVKSHVPGLQLVDSGQTSGNTVADVFRPPVMSFTGAPFGTRPCTTV